ncbi:MAG: radical SAM protein [bacterium]
MVKTVINNKNKIQEKDKEGIFIFLYPNYHCLGNCLFCYLDKNIRLRREEMTLSEVKKNIAFFKKKYLVRDIVIMGGEPFLWSTMDSFIDFMVNDFSSSPVNLIISTEALDFSSDNFLKRLDKAKKSAKFKLFFQIPINLYCENNEIIQKRRKAVLNLAKNGFRVRYILFFTNDKSDLIKNEAKFLIDVFSRYYKKNDPEDFCIELRLPFCHNFDIFAPEYKIFKKSFYEISELLMNNNIHLLLRNIPFCYLKRKDSDFLNKYNFKKKPFIKVIEINKKKQLSSSKIRIYETSFCGFFPECASCVFKGCCGSINPFYVHKMNYPRPKPFNRNSLRNS